MSFLLKNLHNICSRDKKKKEKHLPVQDVSMYHSPQTPRRINGGGTIGPSQSRSGTGLYRTQSMFTIWESEPAAIVHRSKVTFEVAEAVPSSDYLITDKIEEEEEHTISESSNQEEVRLRRREASIKKDGLEAGFDVEGREVRSAKEAQQRQQGVRQKEFNHWPVKDESRDATPSSRVVRCVSTASLPHFQQHHSSSQFKPDEVFSVTHSASSHSGMGNKSEFYAQPTAVVGPRQNRSTGYQQPHPIDIDYYSEHDHSLPVSESFSILPPTVGHLRGDFLSDTPKGHRHNQRQQEREHEREHDHGRYPPQYRVNGNVQTHRASFYDAPHISHSAHALSQSQRQPVLNGNHSQHLNKAAIAPQQISGQRRYSSGRHDSDHLVLNCASYERRNSAGGANSHGLDLPAYNSVMARMNGEERIVDGPPSLLATPTSSGSSQEHQPLTSAADQHKMARLEAQVNELQGKISVLISQSKQPAQGQINSQSSSFSNQDEYYSLEAKYHDEKDRYKQLQQAYKKLSAQYEALQADYEANFQQLTEQYERAKHDLTEFQLKQYSMEEELALLREKSTSPSLDAQRAKELQARQEQIRQLNMELTNHRTEVAKLELMRKDYERVKGEREYLQSKADALERQDKEKDEKIKELQHQLAATRGDSAGAAGCQQSCSSGSTPVADYAESMHDVMARSMPGGFASVSHGRPSRVAAPRTYQKAHTTLGGGNGLDAPSSLSSKRSISGSRSRLPLLPPALTKSHSTFALNTIGSGDASIVTAAEITPQMSQSIRSQEKKLVDSRLTTRCLVGLLQQLSKGEKADVTRMLGLKSESLSESEVEALAAEPDSTPLTINAAEKKLRAQEDRMSHLESDLDEIRRLMRKMYEDKLGGESLLGGEGNQDKGNEQCYIQ